MPHPPYFPDEAPNDFWLYPRWKNEIREIMSESEAQVKSTVTKVLRPIPTYEYKKWYESWIKRWQQCADAQGVYFD